MESDESYFLMMETISVKIVTDQNWLVKEKKKIMEKILGSCRDV